MLFIKFLADIVLNQFLLHLRNSIPIALTAEPYRTITPTKASCELTQPKPMIRIRGIKFNNGTAYYTYNGHLVTFS